MTFNDLTIHLPEWRVMFFFLLGVQCSTKKEKYFTQPHHSHGLLTGSGQEHIQGSLLINSQESQTFQQNATSLPNQGTQVPISGADVSTQILQHRIPSGNVYLQERQIQRPQADVISTEIASKNYQGHFRSNIQPQGNMQLLNQPAQESLQPRK